MLHFSIFKKLAIKSNSARSPTELCCPPTITIRPVLFMSTHAQHVHSQKTAKICF